MPGYKLCSSDYNSIGQNYLCNFCGFLLRDAMQTGCGHLLQAYSLRKSRAVSWSLFAGRIGVAYLEYWTGSIAPGFSSSSRSCSIFSLRAYGTGLALWKTELALWSTWVLAFTPSIRSSSKKMSEFLDDPFQTPITWWKQLNSRSVQFNYSQPVPSKQRWSLSRNLTEPYRFLLAWPLPLYNCEGQLQMSPEEVLFFLRPGSQRFSHGQWSPASTSISKGCPVIFLWILCEINGPPCRNQVFPL